MVIGQVKGETMDKQDLLFWIVLCLLLFVLPFCGYQMGLSKQLGDMTMSRDIVFLEQARIRFTNNHEYINGTYNCVNFSKDFSRIMSELGYNITTDFGYNNESGHAWNKLSFDYDPQNGDMNNTKIYPTKYSDKFLEKYK